MVPPDDFLAFLRNGNGNLVPTATFRPKLRDTKNIIHLWRQKAIKETLHCISELAVNFVALYIVCSQQYSTPT